MLDFDYYRRFYQEHLERQVLPFWKKALDTVHGGVFTGFDLNGEKLLHKDKFTWSQGRFLWIWSRLADLCRKGWINGNAEEYLSQAGQTYRFLQEHAFLEDGRCAFLLSEDGTLKEMMPGKGHDLSFYADCFVIMGMAEFARVSGSRQVWYEASRLYNGVESRLEKGDVRSEPYPIPEGYDAHGFAMIMLNTSQELAASYEQLFGTPSAYREKAKHYMNRILNDFCDEEYRIREIIQGSGSMDDAYMLSRHINPGHTLECMWFVMEEAEKYRDREAFRKAAAIANQACRMGWDTEHGGLLRYVDWEGGEPQGQTLPGAERFEKLISETWDTKLWWPHSEGVYTLFLTYILTRDPKWADQFQQMHLYTFNTFPDQRGREWIQIRNRLGKPLEQVVALPVKDPYHIVRNLLKLIERTQTVTDVPTFPPESP